MKSILAVLLLMFYLLTPAFAKKDEVHTSDSKSMHSEEKEHSDHEDEAGHEHKESEESHADHEEGEVHDDYDEENEGQGQVHDEKEEEGSPVVGPNKGILEKGKKGFKLAPEALKTFDLKSELIKTKVIEVVRLALVEIKNDKFIYRIRDEWIKKVAVKVLKKDSQRVIVDISQFKEGDQIITNGVGFVRTAELVVEEGVSHGHSH